MALLDGDQNDWLSLVVRGVFGAVLGGFLGAVAIDRDVADTSSWLLQAGVCAVIGGVLTIAFGDRLFEWFSRFYWWGRPPR